MRILTGDDTGLIKSLSIEEKKLLATFGEQKDSSGIEFLTYLNGEETYLSSCTRNKTVLLYELDSEKKGELKTTLYEYDLLDKSAPVVGFNYMGEDTKRIIITNASGFTSQLALDFEEGTLNSYEDLFTVPYKGINRVKMNPINKGQLFFLSKDVNPQIWDVNTSKNVWKARNVKNDFLDLKVPVHDLDVCFPADGKSCIVTTAYHKIRTYDILKSNSQPVIDFELPYEKSPLNNVILSHCSNYLYVSNNIGSVLQLDIRKNFMLVGKLKGATGSIKAMSLHSTSNYIATACLDRFLRIYDLNNSNKLIYRIFMKHRLSCLLFSLEELNTDMMGSEEEELFLKKDHNVKIDDEKKQLLKKKRKHSIKLPYFDPSTVPVPEEVIEEKKNPKKAKKNKMGFLDDEEGNDIEGNEKEDDDDDDDDQNEEIMGNDYDDDDEVGEDDEGGRKGGKMNKKKRVVKFPQKKKPNKQRKGKQNAHKEFAVKKKTKF